MSEDVYPTAASETAARREITFSVDGHACRLPIDPPGDPTVPSAFLVGLPKAGSTLLNLTLRPLLQNAGLTYVNLPGALQELGVPPRAYPPELNAAFEPVGYAFGGFRSLPGAFALPPYASGRTILLIRDPRDMLSSLFFSVAFSHAPPGAGVGGALARRFDKTRDEAREIGIDAFVLANVKAVLLQFAWVERKLATLNYRFYRYEDIIFDKLNWTRDMLRHLHLTVDEGRIEQAVARQDILPAEEDASRHVRKVAPGDHVEKLRPQTIERLNAHFAPILAKYGYT